MTRTGADTQLSSSLIVRMMYCKPVLLVNLGSVYVNFNAGFSEKSSIPFPIIFVSKWKLCVCQSSTQIGKVCLTICTSPPACLCHSLTNHGVISCLKTSLASTLSLSSFQREQIFFILCSTEPPCVNKYSGLLCTLWQAACPGTLGFVHGVAVGCLCLGIQSQWSECSVK